MLRSLGTKEKPLLFNRISFVYGLFFKWQMGNYKSMLDKVKNDNFPRMRYKNVIDVGCGTGALCNVLHEYGFAVTGVDHAEKMIEIAREKTAEMVAGKTGNTAESKTGTERIKFMQGDVLHGLPFENKSFDLAVSSYAAHGLKPRERLMMYEEMRRVSKHLVVLIDYNESRSLIINIAEWLEGGDYFNFIKTIKDELEAQFGNIKVINTGKHSSIYICKI